MLFMTFLNKLTSPAQTSDFDIIFMKTGRSKVRWGHALLW